MGRYVARRILHTIPVLFGTTFVIFALVFALPGDPIKGLAGDQQLSPSVQHQLREKYHLNDSLPVQYAKYMAGLAHGDLGTDFNGDSVSSQLASRWPVTLKPGPAPLAKLDATAYCVWPNSCCQAARTSGLTTTRPTFQSYEALPPRAVR